MTSNDLDSNHICLNIPNSLLIFKRLTLCSYCSGRSKKPVEQVNAEFATNIICTNCFFQLEHHFNHKNILFEFPFSTHFKRIVAPVLCLCPPWLYDLLYLLTDRKAIYRFVCIRDYLYGQFGPGKVTAYIKWKLKAMQRTGVQWPKVKRYIVTKILVIFCCLRSLKGEILVHYLHVYIASGNLLVAAWKCPWWLCHVKEYSFSWKIKSQQIA